jgi:hypothetical protein
MKAPGVFGLFFILLICFIIWNEFKIPTFFWEKTETTKGFVVANKPLPFIGRNYRQMICYHYLVGVTVYTHNTKLGGREKIRFVGTKIDVRFDTENPEKNKIETLYKQA